MFKQKTVVEVQVVCDISGEVLPGVFPSLKDAAKAAATAGWTTVGKSRVIVSPAVAADMPVVIQKNPASVVKP